MLRYLFLTLSFICIPAESYTINDTNTLYTNLLQGYNKHVRGKTDQTQPTVLSVKFYLVSINEFEEVTGKFSAIGFFDMLWQDERMVWNMGLYNGVQTIKFNQKDVWKPVIIVGNPYSNLEAIGISDMYIVYDNVGNSLWRPGDLYEFTCFPDVKYYPYDSQECEILFLPWGFSGSEITFSLMSTEMDLELYTESGIWHVVKTNVNVENAAAGLQLISMKIYLERRSGFYLINMILPIGAMGLLNIFVFLLPAESGERVGYCITVLLAIAVFQTIASDNLPKSSYPTVSLLCLKLLADLCVSCVVMVLTIISLRIYNKDSSQPVPKWLIRMTNFLLCRCSKTGCKKGTPVNGESIIEIKSSGQGGKWCDSKGPVEDSTQNVADDPSWADVGKAFDLLFATMSLAAFICSNAIYFVEIQNAPGVLDKK